MVIVSNMNDQGTNLYLWNEELNDSNLGEHKKDEGSHILPQLRQPYTSGGRWHG